MGVLMLVAAVVVGTVVGIKLIPTWLGSGSPGPTSPLTTFPGGFDKSPMVTTDERQQDRTRPVTALPRDAGALRRLRFFSELTDDDLVRVAKIGRRRSFDAGEVLVQRGAGSGGLFVILSGRVSVDVGGATHQLGPGEFFGEMALLGGTQGPSGTGTDFFGESASLSRARRSANVTAIEPVEALVIETLYFEPFLIENPSVAVAILHGVVERLREVQDRTEGGAP